MKYWENMLTKMQCHGLHRLIPTDIVDMKQEWLLGK